MSDTKKLFGFAVTIIASTVAALAWFSSSIATAVTSHAQHPHAPTEQRLAAGERAQAQTDTAVAVHDEKLERLGAIEAKLDLVVAGVVENSNRSPRGRARLSRAAAQARSAAKDRGTKGDPLAGLEGL